MLLCVFVVGGLSLFCCLSCLVEVLEYDAMEHLMAGTDRLSTQWISQPKMGEYHESKLLSRLYLKKYS